MKRISKVGVLQYFSTLDYVGIICAFCFNDFRYLAAVCYLLLVTD